MADRVPDVLKTGDVSPAPADHTDTAVAARSRAQGYEAQAKVKDPGVNEYRGFQIRAWPRLHDDIAAELARRVPKGGTVLDLAAGSGAMGRRLADMG